MFPFFFSLWTVGRVFFCQKYLRSQKIEADVGGVACQVSNLVLSMGATEGRVFFPEARV